MANAELNVILSADGKQLAATMAKAEKDVQLLESELSTLPAAFSQVDKGANKSTAALSKAAAQAVKASKTIKDIAPATLEVSDALQKLQNDLGGLDFSGRFVEAQARIDASIDAMAASALSGGEAIEKMGIEASQAAPKFTQLQTAVTRFGGGALAFSRANFNIVHGIQKTEAALKKLPTASNASTNALINLGRVAQDAPFGIIGIANNINPLLESFQRLKKESGSTKTALKSLAGGLIGGGGLGLAVSVVTSLMTIFALRSQGAGKAAKEADEAFQSMAGHFADEATKLTTLVGVATNLNASYDDRKKALQAINQEYKSYISNLDIEKVTAENVATAYNKIIDALLRQAVVKGLQEEISKVVAETAKKIISIEVAEKKRLAAVEAATKKVLKQETAADRAARAQRGQNSVIADGVIANQRAAVGLTKLVESNNDYEGVLARVKGQLNEQLAPLLSLTTNFEDLGISLDKDKGKVDKFYDNLIKRAKALEAFINKNTIRFANFEIDPEAPKSETIKKAQDFIQQALTARETFSLKPQILIENPVLLKSQNYFASLAKEADKIFKDLQEEINKLTKRNPILIQAERVEATEKARGSEFFQALGIASADENAPKSLLTDTQKAAVNLANIMNQTVVPAFDDLFNAIKSGENPLKAFFQGLGQAIQQLIQKLLQAVLQAALLSAITGGSTTFGSAFKSVLGFKAEGGPVFANKPYVVGERGPELFIPQGGGKIIPNNEMNTGLSGVTGGAMDIRIFGQLSGRDIRLSGARQGQYNQRNV